MKKSKKKCGVYCILNQLNGKRYIGSSSNILRRGCTHRNKLRANKNPNRLLQEDWNKYGGEHFLFSILELCEPIELIAREDYWCEYFESNFEGKGYNITPIVYKENHEGRNKRIIPDFISRECKGISVICINRKTKEILEFDSIIEASEKLDIPYKITWDLTTYWKTFNLKKKAYKGWLMIKKEDYDPGFDYINHRKQRPIKEKIKKEPKPYEERNLTRKRIYLLKEDESEERIYDSIITAIIELGLKKVKVHKCLKNEFKRYKTGGWFIKYLD